MNTGKELTEARLRRWLATGDLSALWPDCSAEELRSAHSAICRVTRALLCPRGEAMELRIDNPGMARALGIAAFASGMGPLLGWWAVRGRLRVTPPFAQVLAEHLEHGRRRAALLRGQLKRVLPALEEAGVRAIVLKGLHTGSVYFPEPGTRPAADIDVLVEPNQYAAAAKVLERIGFTESRKTAFGRRSEWSWAGSQQAVASLELETAENPWHLDLHTALERWYFRGLKVGLGSDAFAATSPFVMEGIAARGLAQPYLATFLALHTSYELVRMRLIRLVELLWVILEDRAKGTLKWRDLRSLVEERQLERFVYPALALCESLLPGSIDPEILHLAERAATPRLRRVTRQVEEENFAPLMRRSLDDKLMWARGTGQCLLNLSEWILPSDEGEPLDLLRLYWRRVRMFVRGKATVKAVP
ncbi:hypothetical protein HRbin33_00132 [bacterium HR33]|nr:hypothetical protein HRbin33_00132 [bacterium HR33]